MATYNVVRANHATLVASTVDTVTLSQGGNELVVVNRSGAAEIYFTVGTTGAPPLTPTVLGADCYVVPAAANASVKVFSKYGPVQVQLISTGTPTYSVEVE